MAVYVDVNIVKGCLFSGRPRGPWEILDGPRG